MSGRRARGVIHVARRWLWRLLGACLAVAVVGWPAALASAATNEPPVPSGLHVTAVGSSQISLSWNPPETDGSQPSQYNVYMGTSSGGEPPVGGTSSPSSSTSDTVTGLASGTTYYFKVSAVYPQDCIDPCSPGAPGVESAQSTEVSATTTSEPAPPPPPTGLTATAAGSSRIRLSWTAPAPTPGWSITGYNIYSGTSPGGESPAGSSSDTSDTVSSLSSATTYYFEVTAVYQSCIDQPCQDTQSLRSNEAHATTDRKVIPGLKSQVIDFGPLAAHVVGVRFTVSASASSGLRVSFSSATPRVCSVAGSHVTTHRRGTCTITATQAGNTHYAPAPARTQSFQVGPVTPRTPRTPPALLIALAALILATAAGAVLVRRWLRVHRPNIQVKPQSDADGAVRMRVTGTDVTGTVRIEPHPAQVSSQLERAQP